MKVLQTAVMSLSAVFLVACTTPRAPRVNCTRHLQPINVPASPGRKAPADSTNSPKKAPAPQRQEDPAR